MRELAREFRAAARTLSRDRGFTTLAFLVLSLGIALNIINFAVVHAYLLRSLPYPGSERLYRVQYGPSGQASPSGMEALDWGTLADVLEYRIAWDLDMFYLTGDRYSESAPGAWVTPGFIEGLGIRAAFGRSFLPDDFTPGAVQVALIGHSLWQRRFGGESEIVGRRFQAYVSDRPREAEEFTIVGVLPQDFWHVNPYTEILVPLRAPTYPYLLRLRPDTPVAVVEERITQLVARGSGQLPDGWQARLSSVHGDYVMRVRPILLSVTAAAGLVLLIACANVAFLVLIRATRRVREIAVRMALGANRWLIARMLLAEGLLLGIAATSAGLFFSWLGLEWLAPIVQRQLGRPVPGGDAAIRVDGTVLAAAAGICLATALICFFAPLLSSWRINLLQAIQSSGRSITEGRGSRRTRSVLVVLEVASALALIVSSGLMIRTVLELTKVDYGYRIERVLSAPMAMRQRSYPDVASRTALYERLIPRLAESPGVESAALSDRWVFQQPLPQAVRADPAAGPAGVQTGLIGVSPDYFSLLGIPVLDGRVFSAFDRDGSEPVAVISRTLARRLWPDRSPLGERIFVDRRDMGAVESGPPVERRVIGVVRDVRQTADDDQPADVYIPLLQYPGRFAILYLRTAADPAPMLSRLRSVVGEIDPEVTWNTPRRLQSFLDEQLARPRFLASLLTAFGLFSALVGLLGVYGVIAYAVRQREREIAVRMALGAGPGSITSLFLRQGAAVLGPGIAVGVLGAVAIGRSLQAQLYGVAAVDPATFLAVSVAFTTVGFYAIWWPARRAARTNPAVALREE